MFGSRISSNFFFLNFSEKILLSLEKIHIQHPVNYAFRHLHVILIQHNKWRILFILTQNDSLCTSVIRTCQCPKSLLTSCIIKFFIPVRIGSQISFVSLVGQKTWSRSFLIQPSWTAKIKLEHMCDGYEGNKWYLYLMTPKAKATIWSESISHLNFLV